MTVHDRLPVFDAFDVRRELQAIHFFRARCAQEFSRIQRRSRGTTLGSARAAFSSGDVDVIVFGHSHIPYLHDHAGVCVVNPGSITDRRREPRFSYAVLEREASGRLAPRLVFFGP